MAETSEGWDGTVNEAVIARILNASRAGAFKTPDDFRVTPVANNRRVAIAAGESHQAFIRYRNDQATTVDIPAPAAGRWYLIVQRRNWNGNAVTTLALAADSTTADIPTSAPSLPAGVANTPGASLDLPLAWVWARATDATLVIRDARTFANPADNIPVSPARIRLLADNLVVAGGSSGKFGAALFGTVALGSRGAEFFSEGADRVITVRRDCRARIRGVITATRAAGAIEAAGMGSAKIFVLRNSTDYSRDPGAAVLAESEVSLYTSYRQWLYLDAEVDLRAGDLLRVSHNNNSPHGVTWGSPTNTSTKTFLEISVVGQYADAA